MLVEGSPIDSVSKLVLSQEVKTQGVQVEAEQHAKSDKCLGL